MPPTPRPDTPAIAAEILRQVATRGPGSSICPSEVARAMAPEEVAWRALLGPVREAAFALARQGALEVLRKGRPVPPPGPEGVKGVIRLRQPGEAPDRGEPEGGCELVSPSTPAMLLGRGTAGLPAPAPIDFPALALPPSPNAFLAAPPGDSTLAHRAVPPLPVPLKEAWAALRQLCERFPRTWRMAEWPDLRQAQWVARSRLANFPDLVNAALVPLPSGGTGLWLYSRSLIGWSDLGVNRARGEAWIAALDAALRQG